MSTSGVKLDRLSQRKLDYINEKISMPINELKPHEKAMLLYSIRTSKDHFKH